MVRACKHWGPCLGCGPQDVTATGAPRPFGYTHCGVCGAPATDFILVRKN
jgi:hypothetical protein